MDSLSERLQSRAVFKFIVGIHNIDWDDVRFLTQVYTQAGADIIDVAARPDAVAIVREAMARTRGDGPDPAPAPIIMASLALEHDPHVAGVRVPPEHRMHVVPSDASAMVATVRACLQQGAGAVELHASDSEDSALREAVEALSAELGGRYLSVCLGTEGLRSPRGAIRQADLVREIHGPKTMIQAEGITLAKDGSPASCVQGLALAQSLLANTGAHVLVAGGANCWTRSLADLLGIRVHGIASGSFARSLVEGFRPSGADGRDVAPAARMARRFACQAKGVPCRDV